MHQLFGVYLFHDGLYHVSLCLYNLNHDGLDHDHPFYLDGLWEVILVLEMIYLF